MKRLLIFVFTLLTSAAAMAGDFRGVQFISFDQFKEFGRDENSLSSKFIQPEIAWDELVVSWNMAAGAQNGVEIDLEYGTDTDAKIPYHRLATWRLSTNRMSGRPQRLAGGGADAGFIDTDTWKLPRPKRAKIRVHLGFIDGSKPEDLKFLSLAFRDSTARPNSLEPNKQAWGKTIEVRPRSQLDYPEGAKIWCSPTSTSMVLDYWSQKLNRPELSLTVPTVAQAVHDVVYAGTGNWPFNTAFAGSFPGMRGYVTRLTDMSELEDWIDASIPVVTSVSYNRLKGKGTSGSGHLIVCIGFTEAGDIVVNDPGTELSNVRRVFSRELFREAWNDSGNTVYVIHPEASKLPRDRFGHWESVPR
jgi:hypothetical protein